MKKRYNIENLTPFNEMPPERHREISAMGGRASGAARRKDRALREYCTILMAQAFAIEPLADDLREFKRWKKRRDAKLKKGQPDQE